ncbi:MAG: metallophosphoesterase [Hyphomicrobium sp.]|nr:metallophosphoesterase [Hyphomicrobium sp.]
MISRRGFLKGAAAFVAGGVGLAGYAFGVEPMRTLVTRYAIRPGNWPEGLKLKIAVLADIHACKPWMTVERIRDLAHQTNALGADIIVLLGDYCAGHHWVTDWVHSSEWSAALGELKAPLGVHAVLGNHDWWEDKTAQRQGHGPVFSQTALEKFGIRVYDNDAVRLSKADQPFWIAGLGDQLALLPGKKYGRKRMTGVDDLPATMAKITDHSPVILLAHEPDIFPVVPERVSLTLSGHTHGGQVRVFGYSPVVPSRYRNRYAYGHIVEASMMEVAALPRHLVVSGGLGCAIMPVRFGMPPEIVVVELGGEGLV